jgi:hypothetical protein
VERACKVLIDQCVESGGKHVGFALVTFIDRQHSVKAIHNKLAAVKPLRVLNHLRHKQLDVRCIICVTLRMSFGVRKTVHAWKNEFFAGDRAWGFIHLCFAVISSHELVQHVGLLNAVSQSFDIAHTVNASSVVAPNFTSNAT